MNIPPENRVFFDEDIIDRETWRLKRLTDTAQGLIAGKRSLYAFIRSEDPTSNRFLISLGPTPDNPLCVYETDVIDEDAKPRLRCTFSRS